MMRDSENGSAPAEFVLLTAPLVLLFYSTLSLVLAGVLQQQTVTLAANLAQVCGLRDVNEQDVSRISEEMRLVFVRIENLTCSRDEDLSEVTLTSSFASPMQYLKTTVSWHATSETF